MNREKRGEVFSIFRDAFDGHCSKSFGTGQIKSFQSRFNLIAAVTGEIDRCAESMQSLGERFLRLNVQIGNDQSRIEFALENANLETQMRQELCTAACGMLKSASEQPPNLNETFKKQVVALARLLAVGRTSVSRDRAKEIVYPPQAEGR
jgi:hypothetical protein